MEFYSSKWDTQSEKEKEAEKARKQKFEVIYHQKTGNAAKDFKGLITEDMNEANDRTLTKAYARER